MGKSLLLSFGACVAIVVAGVDLDREYRSSQMENSVPDLSAYTKPDGSEHVTYSHAAGQSLGMNLYRPKAAGRTAAILMLHGGGWLGGSPLEMAEFGEYIAAHGNLAASAEYRLAPRYQWPAQLDDVQTAVRYLRKNADKLNIDPNRIASIGISAGGHLSLFLGATEATHPLEYSGVSSRVEAVGSISGIHDLRLMMTPVGESFHIIETLVGAREGDKVADASPILRTTKATAPTYFLQGQEDPWVPANQTEEASKRLKALSVPEEVEMVPGMGHGMTLKKPEEAEAFARMMTWILDRLNAGH
jgi:acetyl esterase/lipase